MAYKDPERQREWMKRNPEKAREAMRRWRERNPELRRERNRAYKRLAYERRGDEINAQKDAWLAAHAEVRRAREQAYRARRSAAEGSFTGAEWLALVEEFAVRCGCCGEVRPLRAEHRLPLTRGGTNTIANIVGSCGPCDRRKGQRTELELRALLAKERRDDR